MFSVNSRTAELIISQCDRNDKNAIGKKVKQLYDDVDRNIAKLIRDGADSDSFYIVNIIEDCNKLKNLCENVGIKFD